MRGPRIAMKSGPRLPQLEKALPQKRRPNTAINKLKKKKKIFSSKKKKKKLHFELGLRLNSSQNLVLILEHNLIMTIWLIEKRQGYKEITMPQLLKPHNHEILIFMT